MKSSTLGKTRHRAPLELSRLRAAAAHSSSLGPQLNAMTLDDFTARFAAFLTFWANLVVCAAAVRFYQRRPMRPVLLIAISSGIGALLAVVPWLVGRDTASSRAFWYLITFVGAADMVVWAVGSCWFFREYERREQRPAD